MVITAVCTHQKQRDPSASWGHDGTWMTFGSLEPSRSQKRQQKNWRVPCFLCKVPIFLLPPQGWGCNGLSWCQLSAHWRCFVLPLKTRHQQRHKTHWLICQEFFLFIHLSSKLVECTIQRSTKEEWNLITWHDKVFIKGYLRVPDVTFPCLIIMDGKSKLFSFHIYCTSQSENKSTHKKNVKITTTKNFSALQVMWTYWPFIIAI